MSLPQVHPRPSMPDRITVYEVGPRDGLQNEKAIVPTAVKEQFVRRLVAAGCDLVETTSFVPAAWVPQMGDAAELLGGLGDLGRGRSRPVLVPNERGLDAALTAGVGAVAVFGSATETFAQRNLNRSVAQSLQMFAPVVRRAKDEGLWVRAYVSMCFGDPWEGAGAYRRRSWTSASAMMDLGADQLCLGDTIGTGTPGHVIRPAGCIEREVGIEPGGVGCALPRHLRSGSGQLPRGHGPFGVRTVDSSAGGLGGCPYRQERDRQPRHRGPGLGVPGVGHRDGDRSGRSGRYQCVDGQPVGPALAVGRVVRALGGEST